MMAESIFNGFSTGTDVTTVDGLGGCRQAECPEHAAGKYENLHPADLAMV